MRRAQILWILAILATVVCLDQITKSLIVSYLEPGTFVFGRGPAESRFFDIAHERNTGLVGGMFREKPIIAFTAPLLALCVLVYLFKHLQPESKLQNIAYGLIAGGAIGNQIDRFFRESVVDFLQFNFYFVPFNFPWKYYPAFNVADSAICTGVFLLILGWHVLGTAQSHVANPT